MRMRKLGALEVSELGFGVLSFASTYGQAPERAESIRVIRPGARDRGRHRPKPRLEHFLQARRDRSNESRPLRASKAAGVSISRRHFRPVEIAAFLSGSGICVEAKSVLEDIRPPPKSRAGRMPALRDCGTGHVECSAHLPRGTGRLGRRHRALDPVPRRRGDGGDGRGRLQRGFRAIRSAERALAGHDGQ